GGGCCYIKNMPLNRFKSTRKNWKNRDQHSTDVLRALLDETKKKIEPVKEQLKTPEDYQEYFRDLPTLNTDWRTLVVRASKRAFEGNYTAIQELYKVLRTGFILEEVASFFQTMDFFESLNENPAGFFKGWGIEEAEVRTFLASLFHPRLVHYKL